MKITCSRKFEFDAAHRVMEHEHKCKLLHGHRYILELSVTAPALDELGRVIDFAILKEIIGTWLNENFDHNVILHQNDRALGEAIAQTTGQQIFYLPYNPTAENIALYLATEIFPALLSPYAEIQLDSIKLFETSNSYATISFK